MALNRFSIIIVPLPPLAEQHAIVERVEKLLVMVEVLEKQAMDLMQAVLRKAFERKQTESDNYPKEIK